MVDRIRIFICYKKKSADGRENNAAYQLYQFLTEVPEYDVWMDEGLDAGILWEKTIYENLVSTDVVILAIGDGTSASEWVRRELSIAMAFDIHIVPVGLNISESQLSQELHNLGLTGIHYRRPFNIDSQTARGIVPKLEPAVRKACENTRLGGYQLLKKINKKVEPSVQEAKPSLSVEDRTCTVGSRQVTLHIASGDIFRLSNYDILVNSENDYMQMARIFDMASLSSNIRHRGSSEEKGYEDTIQLEIEKLIVGRPRPLPAASTITTSSGGPSSRLYEVNKVSHIIHVAAVHAMPGSRKIMPLADAGQIRDCVAAALAAAQRLCKQKGVVSPEGSPQRQLQDQVSGQFAPKRLVMPLFGTGRGGQSPAIVGPIVLEAILEFFAGPLYQAENMPLTDIHLSVFSEEDVGTMVNALSKAVAKH